MPATNTEQELIAQLSSDKKSLRINAITRLLRSGSSKEALEALTPFLTKGSREEVLYATQAIAKISKKLGISVPADSTQPPTINNNNSKEPSVKDFLEAKRDQAPNLLQYIRNTENIPEDLMPSIGVFLGKHGDKSDTSFIQNYLIHHNDNLTLPYISAAEKIDISILIPVLPYLLASSEPLVRSRAVMALRKIDSKEAERHFLNLLASKKAENRLSALEISFLFPFDRVKDYILALLSEEKDPDVLKACATVLASNPSQETALRILDIVESQPVNLRKPSTTIFNIVSAAIATAKLLPPEKATPQALVNTWKELRLKNFLNDLEIQLSTTTGQKREAIISWLEKNINIKQVSDFIERLALNPQTEDVYQRLTNQYTADNLSLPDLNTFVSHQNDNSQQNTKIESQPLATNSYATEPKSLNSALPEIQQNVKSIDNEQESKSEKAQIRYLKKLNIEDFQNAKNQIIELAENSEVSPRIRAEALNALLRLSPNMKIKQYGLKALSEPDEKLQTAGFKILERVAPDALKNRLSNLLLSSNDTIRIRAIRFGLKYDQAKSIEALKNLINTEDQNNRSNAVNCLALCPFEAVYEILMKALKKETHPLVAKQIISVFLNNPDSAILAMLDKLSIVTKDPSIEMVIQQGRNELEEILSTITQDAKDRNLVEIDLFESNMQRQEEKPYSVENVRKLASSKPSSKKAPEKESSGLLKKLLGEYKWLTLCGALFLVLCLLCFYAFITDKNNGIGARSKYSKASRQAKGQINERSIKKSSKKIPTSLTMGKPCNINATVTKVEGSNLLVKYDRRELYIKFQGNEAKNIKAGDKVSITCIPYKQNPNSVILAKGKRINKVK